MCFRNSMAFVAIVGFFAVSLIGCGGGESVEPVQNQPILIVSTTPLEWGAEAAWSVGGEYLCSTDRANILAAIKETAQNDPCLIFLFGEFIIEKENFMVGDYDSPKAGISIGEEVLPFIELSRAAGWSTRQVWVFDGSSFSMQFTYWYFDRNAEGELYGDDVHRAALGCWENSQDFGGQDFFEELSFRKDILTAYRARESGRYMWDGWNAANWKPFLR